MTDLITQLGYMCMGSRLKRLGERMQAGVAQILEAQGHAVQPSHMPLLIALGGQGAMTIGALSEAVGISQPGTTRAATRLQQLGLVEPAKAQDRRQRAIALTAEGQALLAHLTAILYPAVERAVADLCAVAGGNLLATVGRVEAALDATPLDARIAGQKEMAA
jgi:DNA-binding MarR family transcriptional regulator